MEDIKRTKHLGYIEFDNLLDSEITNLLTLELVIKFDSSYQVPSHEFVPKGEVNPIGYLRVVTPSLEAIEKISFETVFRSVIEYARSYAESLHDTVADIMIDRGISRIDKYSILEHWQVNVPPITANVAYDLTKLIKGE